MHRTSDMFAKDTYQTTPAGYNSNIVAGSSTGGGKFGDPQGYMSAEEAFTNQEKNTLTLQNYNTEYV